MNGSKVVVMGVSWLMRNLIPSADVAPDPMLKHSLRGFFSKEAIASNLYLRKKGGRND